MANNRKLKLTYPDGTFKVKPWSSKFYSNALHLKDAKQAYSHLIKEESVVITIY